MTSWWLDERAYAGEEHLDALYVAGYERKAGFDPTEDLEVLQHLGLGSDAIVVDLGAGTGAFVVAVAPLCRRVVAVDVSPAMTANLRERVAELGLDNVSVVDAGFLSYEHRGAPADVIFTRNALHQLPDFWKAIALERTASWLRPGGILRLHDVIFDFAPPDAPERIETWLAGAATDPSIGWTAAELAEHVRHEFSTYSWLLDLMLDGAGFDVAERSFRRSVYGTYTCTRRAEWHAFDRLAGYRRAGPGCTAMVPSTSDQARDML
jgi:SAM-dependent methyltransferase